MLTSIKEELKVLRIQGHSCNDQEEYIEHEYLIIESLYNSFLVNFPADSKTWLKTFWDRR